MFSAPVNMTNIVKNFNSIFYVYVNSITRNCTDEIIDFEITESDDDMTFNFTVEFQWPYLYGLLNKKKDYLVIGIINNTNQSGIIFNTTADVMGNNNT